MSSRNGFRCLWMFNDSTPPYWSSKVSPKLTSKDKTSCVLPPPAWCSQRRYHYFLVLDFEATCDKPQIHPQEIIEFPILKLNGRTMEIESTFHMYVQPVVHPQLTPFCTELTGIIQGMVDGQPSLQQVLERVDEWMAKEGLLDPSVKSIFVTCGDWDLKVMLPGQCQYLGLPVADYFKQWINLKKAYSFAMGSWPKNGLLDMNKGLNLQHIGRPHSGIGTRSPRLLCLLLTDQEHTSKPYYTQARGLGPAGHSRRVLARKSPRARDAASLVLLTASARGFTASLCHGAEGEGRSPLPGQVSSPCGERPSKHPAPSRPRLSLFVS
uniref:ERI1 exoribonuclease family member 3 n=1 Tax=Anas zonorhyncha TaxID=75864 RepID=A0A8B9UIG5_9AVES